MKDGRRNSLHKSTQAGAPVLPPEFSSAGWDGFVLEHHRHSAFELPHLTLTSYVVAVAVGRPFKAEVRRGGGGVQLEIARRDARGFPFGVPIYGRALGGSRFIPLPLSTAGL